MARKFKGPEGFVKAIQYDQNIEDIYKLVGTTLADKLKVKRTDWVVQKLKTAEIKVFSDSEFKRNYESIEMVG